MTEVFSLTKVTQSWLWGSQTAARKGRSNGRIHLSKVEERLAGECMATLLWVGKLMIEIDTFYGRDFRGTAC